MDHSRLVLQPKVVRRFFIIIIIIYSPSNCHVKTQLEIACEPAASLAAGLARPDRSPSPARGTAKPLVPTNELQLLPVASPAPRRVEIAAVAEPPAVPAARGAGEARVTSDDIIKNRNI